MVRSRLATTSCSSHGALPDESPRPPSGVRRARRSRVDSLCRAAGPRLWQLQRPSSRPLDAAACDPSPSPLPDPAVDTRGLGVEHNRIELVLYPLKHIDSPRALGLLVIATDKVWPCRSSPLIGVAQLGAYCGSWSARKASMLIPGRATRHCDEFRARDEALRANVCYHVPRVSRLMIARPAAGRGRS